MAKNEIIFQSHNAGWKVGALPACTLAVCGRAGNTGESLDQSIPTKSSRPLFQI